jgi:hypothetical protein
VLSPFLARPGKSETPVLPERKWRSLLIAEEVALLAGTLRDAQQEVDRTERTPVSLVFSEEMFNSSLVSSFSHYQPAYVNWRTLL